MTATLKIRSLLALTMLLIALSTVWACGDDTDTSDDGDGQVQSVETRAKAPEFTLPAANKGTDISLTQFQGDQPVVLVFYRAYW